MTVDTRRPTSYASGRRIDLIVHELRVAAFVEPSLDVTARSLTAMARTMPYVGRG